MGIVSWFLSLFKKKSKQPEKPVSKPVEFPVAKPEEKPVEQPKAPEVKPDDGSRMVKLEDLPLFESTVGRKLEPALKDLIDKKIFVKSVPQCFLDRNPSEIMLMAADALVGIHEKGGNNSGYEVELIQETVGGHSREPYCMGTVQTCIAYAEIYSGVKSKFLVTEHCMTAWRSTPKELRVEEPSRGSVIIWQHGSSERGHTGITKGLTPKKYRQTVEGNTGTGEGINRDGDGIWNRTRRPGGEGKMKEVGFIDPFKKV